MRSRIFAGTMILLLAGCGGRGSDSPSPAAEAKPLPFDGEYKGVATACDFDKPDNRSTKPITISVAQHNFAYKWSDLIPVMANATIQPDGSVHGTETYSISSSPDWHRKLMTVNGHIEGNALDLQVQGPGCTQTATLAKVRKNPS
jgi:hypothetical protein